MVLEEVRARRRCGRVTGWRVCTGDSRRAPGTPLREGCGGAYPKPRSGRGPQHQRRCRFFQDANIRDGVPSRTTSAGKVRVRKPAPKRLSSAVTTFTLSDRHTDPRRCTDPRAGAPVWPSVALRVLGLQICSPAALDRRTASPPPPPPAPGPSWPLGRLPR